MILTLTLPPISSFHIAPTVGLRLMVFTLNLDQLIPLFTESLIFLTGGMAAKSAVWTVLTWCFWQFPTPPLRYERIQR